MARVGFGIASLASLGFLVWLIVNEIESPGLSFAAALIGLPMLVTLFGLFKINANGIAKDGKGAGWAAIVIALLGVGYVATFFTSWLIIALLWFALHVPMAIGIVLSPTSEA
jgi:hypothetical protein